MQKQSLLLKTNYRQFDEVEHLDGLQQLVFGSSQGSWISMQAEIEQASDEFEGNRTKDSDIAFLSYT